MSDQHSENTSTNSGAAGAGDKDKKAVQSKKGCLGCLGIIVVFVVISVVLGYRKEQQARAAADGIVAVVKAIYPAARVKSLTETSMGKTHVAVEIYIDELGLGVLPGGQERFAVRITPDLKGVVVQDTSPEKLKQNAIYLRLRQFLHEDPTPNPRVGIAMFTMK